MSLWLIALLGGLLVGGGAGVGGTLLLTKKPVSSEVPAVQAAVAPDLTDAQARLAVAQSPAVNLAVEAAVKPDATPYTKALAAYALCLAAAAGKTEGSAAFGCQDRGKVLDAAAEK